MAVETDSDQVIFVSVDIVKITVAVMNRAREIFKTLNSEVDANKIILNALSQSDAFRQFKKSFPSLLKKTTKKYYEKELRF
jgi:hypothetical protein